LEERRAAMFLDMSPIDSKLDIWWEEIDKKTQTYLKDMEWGQDKWDDEWELHDLPIKTKKWNDLSDKERTAATYLGYTKCKWDETSDDEKDVDFNTVRHYM
jgi:hypothetical protein